MSIADQFAADAAAAGAQQQPQMTLAQQFAADAAAGSKIPASAAGGTGAAAPQTAAGQPPGALASSVIGFGKGLGNTVAGLEQLAGRGASAVGLDKVGNYLTSDANWQLGQIKSGAAPAEAAHPIATGVGNIAGQVFAQAPLAMVAPETAGMGLLGRAATGAALGGASGLMSPVDNVQPSPQGGDNFWSQKLGQAGTGALVGGIATPVTAGIGSMVSGVTDPLRQKMADMGISMTPGQIAGGAWQTLENKATSLPLIGDMIKGAQQRGVQSFNRATYDQVLAPLGQKYSGPIGQEGVQAVKQTIGDAYDNALGNMTFRATDPQFQSDITNLTGLAQGLPAAQQKQFMNTLNTQIFGKLSPQGWMDGQTLKGVQEELGKTAKGYLGDASYDNRQLGAAIGEIKSAVNNSLPRYNAPEAVQDLANANSAYANYVRLRGAARSQGAMNNGGIFSPAQLQSAVRSADKSVGKGASATGNALMQGFSQDAMNVLGKGYPDSGTAGRLGTAGALGALFSHPGMLLSPWTYAAAAPALAYTPMGQRVAQGLLMSRPAAMQAVGNAITNRLAPLTPGLLGAMSQGGSQ